MGKGFNRDYWARFEKFVKDLTKRADEVLVVTGPLYMPAKDVSGTWAMRHPLLGGGAERWAAAAAVTGVACLYMYCCMCCCGPCCCSCCCAATCVGAEHLTVVWCCVATSTQHDGGISTGAPPLQAQHQHLSCTYAYWLPCHPRQQASLPA